jgi:hypothetical protein
MGGKDTTDSELLTAKDTLERKSNIRSWVSMSRTSRGYRTTCKRDETRIQRIDGKSRLDCAFFPVHIIPNATHIQQWDVGMRRVSLRCLRRRQPGQGHYEPPNHRVGVVQARQQNTLTSIPDSESRFGHNPVPRIKDILADLNRYTSRVHLPLTSVAAKTEFRRVVSRMLGAAMATEPTGPTTRSYLTPTGLRKIEPYWYPYTTMAKGRWLGREMLEVVSTEFRDRSIDYYVSLSFFSQCPHKQNSRFHPEICSRIWSDDYQREDRQTRYHNPER